jgi:hypothetical protein
MEYLSKFFSNHNYRNSYIIVGIIACVSYYFVRQLFINQSAWGFIKTSQLTFNIIILFGLWGGFHHLIIKVKNPYWDKVILVAGFIVIVLLLRLFGMKTIFG